GMSDLLSPILYVMENEVDAFWCFVSFMDQMVRNRAKSEPEPSMFDVCIVQHQNFEEQMQGMKTQLIQLSTLLRLLDLAFWNYLGTEQPVGSHSAYVPVLDPSHWTCFCVSESQESGYLYFCFRWLLIRFKRELSFQDVLRLWEVSLEIRSCEGSSSRSLRPAEDQSSVHLTWMALN
ncbi:hypothetical protein XENOCAPTIV_023310, partial [Xenoophorus captivus]